MSAPPAPVKQDSTGDGEEGKSTAGDAVVSSLLKRDELTGEFDEKIVAAEGEERTTAFVVLLVGAAAIGGLLFGYDTGVIGGALIHKDIARDLGRETLTNSAKEILTSATTLGALFGGFGSGLLADLIGRKAVIAIADVVFIVGAVMQAAAVGKGAYWIMAAGRLVIGLGVGLAALIVLYIGELAPTALRGRLVTLNVVAITLGQVLAYIVDLIFDDTREGWRVMVAIGAAPPILQLCLLGVLPESPRYLLRHNKLAPTLKILAKVYPYATPAQIEMKASVISASVRENMGSDRNFIATWKQLHFVGANFRGLVIACGLQGIQQLSGFNTLLYYSPTLFQSVGFENPILIGLVIALTNFIFTLIALWIIDKAGRRRIACLTIPGMSAALILAAVAFHFLTLNTGGQLPDNGVGLDSRYGPVVLAAMIIYVACYATGIGNIPWQQGELFEMNVRGMGVSISTTCNWGANLIIGSTFLSLIARITAAGAFGLYAGLCFLGALFCYFLYPETAGLSLEETRQVFADGFGIKRANKLRRDKEAAMILVRERMAGRDA